MKIRKWWLLFLLMLIASSCADVTIEIVDEYKNKKIVGIDKHIILNNCDGSLELRPFGDSLRVYSEWNIKSKKGTKPIIKKIQYDFYYDETCLMKIDVDSVSTINSLVFRGITINYKKFFRKEDNYNYVSTIYYNIKRDISDSFYFKGSVTIFNNEKDIEYSFLEKIKVFSY